METRSKNFGKPNLITPHPEHLAEGTFYLTKIDEKFRRNYERKNHLPLTRNETKATNKVSEEHEDIEASAKRLETISNHLIQPQRSSSPTSSKGSNQLWSGFHKKTFMERVDQLRKLDPELKTEAFKNGGLYTSIADIMVENCIGKLSLPLGLALNFNVNGKEIQVPMALEEPSVIAACSGVAKTIAKYGGFKTHSTEPIMRGQIQLLVANQEEASMIIEQKKKEIMSYANESCQNMVKRGGGVIDIKTKFIAGDNSTKQLSLEQSDMIIIDLFINVCDSMGANIINTIVEHTAPLIEHLTGGRAGIKILSNLSTERKALAAFEIPVSELAWKNGSGEDVCKKVLEAYQFAKNDIYRATTHNKGIMNGIDSAAIACGQDWRAIEAAAHAYPYVKYGKYGPLTTYKVFKNEKGELYFRGSLELPISVGIVGGVIQNNPVYENSMRLLGYPNAQQLGEILLCVGLANNFAALRAMAIEGIQKGHMNLHAKNIALAAGVPHYLAMDAVEFMKKRGRINKETAKGFLQAIDLYAELRTEENKKLTNPPKNLSTFFLDIHIPGLKENILLNIGLETASGSPVHISIEKENVSKLGPEDMKIKKQLFGDKGYEWLTSFFVEIDIMKFSGKKNVDEENTQKSREVIYKLKLISVLINLITASLVHSDARLITEILKFSVLKEESEPKIKELLKDKPNVLQYGVNLLVELIKIFDYNLDSHLPIKGIKQIIIDELHVTMTSHLKVHEFWLDLKGQKPLDFNKFFIFR